MGAQARSVAVGGPDAGRHALPVALVEPRAQGRLAGSERRREDAAEAAEAEAKQDAEDRPLAQEGRGRSPHRGSQAEALVLWQASRPDDGRLEVAERESAVVSLWRQGISVKAASPRPP